MISNNFELRGKQFFLTYPQCGIPLTVMLEDLMLVFAEKLGCRIDKYILAHENHEDGHAHRHVYLGLSQSVRHKIPANSLDIEGHHPNVQVVRSNERVMKYVVKDGDYITNIEQEIQKARSHLNKMNKEAIGKSLIEGKPLAELTREFPALIFDYVRLRTGFLLFKLDSCSLEALDGPCGVWIGGPPGVGKSIIAETKFGKIYPKNNSKWWDGYDGDDVVVCQDVDVSWTESLYRFKQWADAYPFLAETKNGTIRIRPKKFVCTSNYTIEEVIERGGIKDAGLTAALVRRFRSYWITSIEDWENQL